MGKYQQECDYLGMIHNQAVQIAELQATVAILRGVLTNISAMQIVEQFEIIGDALTSTAEASERFMNEERAKVLEEAAVCIRELKN